MIFPEFCYAASRLHSGSGYNSMKPYQFFSCRIQF